MSVQGLGAITVFNLDVLAITLVAIITDSRYFALSRCLHRRTNRHRIVSAIVLLNAATAVRIFSRTVATGDFDLTRYRRQELRSASRQRLEQIHHALGRRIRWAIVVKG